MKGFLKDVAYGAWVTAKVALLTTVVALLIQVLYNARELETAYFEKYENAYQEVLREHDRQLYMSHMLRSQKSWEETAMALYTAYGEAYQSSKSLEQQLQQMQYDIQVFMWHLEQEYPGLRDEILEKMFPCEPEEDAVDSESSDESVESEVETP